MQVQGQYRARASAERSARDKQEIYGKARENHGENRTLLGMSSVAKRECDP